MFNSFRNTLPYGNLAPRPIFAADICTLSRPASVNCPVAGSKWNSPSMFCRRQPLATMTQQGGTDRGPRRREQTARASNCAAWMSRTTLFTASQRTSAKNLVAKRSAMRANPTTESSRAGISVSFPINWADCAAFTARRLRRVHITSQSLSARRVAGLVGRIS